MKQFVFKEKVTAPGKYNYKTKQRDVVVSEGDLTWDQNMILLRNLERDIDKYPDIVKLMFINKLKRK